MVVLSIETSGCQPQTIVIGRRGTYETTQIAFDLSYLVEAYGSGVAVLAVKRSQDESAYPAVVTQENNTLTWTVSETDTAYVGAGECQLMWYVEGGLAKTIIYQMVVMRDILQTAEEPPDGYENWIEHLTGLGAETQQNAQNAAQSATEAKASEESAAESAQRAEDAAGMLVDVSATATTLEPGQPATAEYDEGVFKFGIPKGDKLTYADLTEADKEDLVQGPIKAAQDAAVDAVGTAKTNAVDAVNGAGTTQVQNVNSAGSTQVNTVNQAGTTQVGNVNQAGATQVQAVEDKGDEVIASIPSDYSDLTAEVDDLTRQLSDLDSNLLSGKMPYIRAYMKSLNTTNYLAVVIPATVLQTSNNSLSFNCYCEDDVTVYFMIYDVDLTQSGNNRLTTRINGQSSTSTKKGNWYNYSNDIYGLDLAPSGQYVALVFNAVRTDDVKTLTEMYIKNIIINGTLIDDIINQVFLYSASPTVFDVTKLYDINVVGVSNIMDKEVGDGCILCIGDSLTAGIYASDGVVHAENYPYYMSELVENAVINKGMPGYSARMYWNNHVLSANDFTNVKHIIIMLGTNGGLTDTLETDVFAHSDYSDYADTQTGCYCKIIEYCMEQAPNAEIYLCTTPFYNKDIVPQFAPPNTPNANAVIPKIAEHYNFSMIDVRHGMGINQKNTLVFQSDGLHGDSGFYQKLGTFIGSQLKAKASFIV